MDLTITEMAEEVALNLGLRPIASLSAAEKTQLAHHMDFGQRLITRMANPRSLQNIDTTQALLTNQLTYTLPTAVKRVYSVRYFDPDLIDVVSTSTDVWNSGGSITASLDTTVTRGGRSTTKFTCAGTGLAYSDSISPVTDLSSYSVAGLRFYIRSSVALDAGDVSITLTEAASGAESGQYITKTLPAVAASSSGYTKIELTGYDFSSGGTLIDALLSVGFLVNNSVTGNIYIDAMELMVDDGLDDRKGYSVDVDTTGRRDMRNPNPLWRSTGRPTTMYMWGDTSTTSDMYFYPVPDNFYILKVRYSGYGTAITDVTASTNTTLRGYDDVLIAAATMYGFQARRQWKAKGEWKADYFTLLKEAKVNDSKLDGWKPLMHGFQGDIRNENLHIDDYDFPEK